MPSATVPTTSPATDKPKASRTAKPRGVLADKAIGQAKPQSKPYKLTDGNGLHIIIGHSALLFPGERDHDKPMSNNTILGALKRMGYAGRMTGHGFRGVAST